MDKQNSVAQPSLIATRFMLCEWKPMYNDYDLSCEAVWNLPRHLVLWGRHIFGGREPQISDTIL